MSTDGNLAALRQYERDQDRLQRESDWLEEIEGEIWTTPSMLADAILAAHSHDSIQRAVEDHSLRILRERQREKY
jgi:hypothetical protein